MTQTATVEQLLDGGRARVAVARQSACGHDCARCAGCAGQVIRATADNPVGAAVGDRVVLRSDAGPVLASAALVYLLPVLAFFLGYGLSAALHSLAARVLIVLGSVALGTVPAVRLDRRARIRYEILERLPPCSDT